MVAPLVPLLYTGAARYAVPAVTKRALPSLLPNVASRLGMGGSGVGGTSLLRPISETVNRMPKPSWVRRHPYMTGIGVAGLANEARQALMGGGDTAGAATVRTPAPTADKPPYEKSISGQITPPPAPTTTEETKGSFAGDLLKSASGVFSDSDRLAKIAMGVALLEGQPIQDAVALSTYIRESGGSVGGKIDVEVVDNDTEEIVAFGNADDANIKALLQNPAKYSVFSRGDYAELKAKGNEAFDDAIAKKSADFLDDLNTKYNDFFLTEEVTKKFLAALESGDLTTGSALESVKVEMAKALNLDEDVADEELLNAFNTELTVQVAQNVSGALSEKELALFQSSQPSLSLSPEANRELLERRLAFGRIYAKKLEYLESAIFEDRTNYIKANKNFNEKFKNDMDFRANVLGVEGVVNSASELENLAPGEYFWNNTDEGFEFELPNGSISSIGYGNFFTIS